MKSLDSRRTEAYRQLSTRYASGEWAENSQAIPSGDFEWPVSAWRWLARRPRLAWTSIKRALAGLPLPLVWALLKLALAVSALLIGLWLLRFSLQGQEVEAVFTRVGGPTRVETAVEASRFWILPPSWVVTVRADESQTIMWSAARCALVLDAPLLFIPKKDSMRWRLFLGTIKRWRKNPTRRGQKALRVFRVGTQESASRCIRNGHTSYASGLSTFETGRPLHPPVPEVGPRKNLAPIVVFAAAKAAGDAPDVGVGLALAGHIATAGRWVSLVVVPRYLQAEPALEDRLRKQRETVERGVLLGQTGILSEDMHALLRQVITARDTRGILGETRTNIDALKAVLAALLAIFGFGTALRAAPEVGQRFVESIPEQVRDPVRRRYLMARERTGLDRSPNEDSWIAGLSEHQEVTVWLRSGGTVSGFVEHQQRHTGVLRLRRATVAQQADDQAGSAADLILVPLEDIALVGAKVDSASGKLHSPIRRAGLRLVAELVATLTGEPLPAIKRSTLLKAIGDAKVQKELTTPGPEDPVWTDLPRMRDDARHARDRELHSALYAVEDGLRLAQRQSGSEVASQNLLEALAELAEISSRRTAATRPR